MVLTVDFFFKKAVTVSPLFWQVDKFLAAFIKENVSGADPT